MLDLFKIPKRTSTIKFSRSPKFYTFVFLDVDLCIKQWCSLEVLIIYCMFYFKCYTYVNAYKLGKYSCPTTSFTSSILYIWCLDIIQNGLFCNCSLRFQLDADFFSFYNSVPPPPPPPPETEDATWICCIYLLRNFVGQRASWVWGGNILKIQLNYMIFSVLRTRLHILWLVFNFFKLQIIYNTKFNDLRKIVWEKLSFDFSKLALVCSIQISGAWHAIAEMEWVHSLVTIATMTFKFIPNISFLCSYQAIKV